MGMLGELATEGTVMLIAIEIKQELEANKDNPEVCQVLKKIGRFSLSQLQGHPLWAEPYVPLFKE